MRYQDRAYDALNDVRINDITDEMLQRGGNDYADGRSPKTVQNVYRLISGTLAFKMPSKGFNVTLPKVGKAKLDLPSQSQVEAALDAAEGTDLCVPVYLAAFGCMRRGEIPSLDTDLIDFDSRKIVISKNAVKDTNHKWVIKKTKNEDDRIVQVPQIVIDKIKKYGLFNHNADYITKEFGRLLDKHKIKHFRFHDLRHFCAARMLSNGIPISVVQEYGGWRDQKVLLNIYDYVIAEVREKSMENWNNFCTNFPKTTHEPQKAS